jgi:DNA-binding NarL/FixJ family response regulator
VGIRVIVADNHQLFRQGVVEILRAGGFDVVGEAADGAQAVVLAAEIAHDVILMDIRMPGLNGLEATLRILQQDPAARVLVLTMYRDDRYILEAVKAGARGFLLKDIDADELCASLKLVHRGEALIDPTLALSVLEEFRRLRDGGDAADALSEQLSVQEMKVLLLVAQGMDNNEIARKESLAVSTVSNRLSEIYAKLRVQNRTQAALEALRRGWASLDEGP